MLAAISTQTLTLAGTGGAVLVAGLTSLTWYLRTRGKSEATPTPPCPHHDDMKRRLERGEDKFIAIDKKLDVQTVAQGDMKQSLGRIEGYLEAMK
ncbi:MAG: hypothetical protein ACTSX8_09405 [Alphaproteobacteria bacterium]